MELLADLGVWAPILVLAGVFALFSLGLQVQVGYGGLLNFGQVAFAAIGAYTMAISTNAGLPLWQGMLLGVAMAVLVALVISLPALRLRGDFLAIVAIASGEIVRNIALNWGDVTGGPKGIVTDAWQVEVARPVLSWARDQGYVIDRLLPILVTVWIFAIVAFIVLRLLVRTPWGRVLRAVREDEDAARALGKNAFVFKVQAMCIGAALGALAGMFGAFNQVVVSPMQYEPIVTFIGFVIIILGGIGSLGGVVVAAIIVQGLMEGTRFISTPYTADQDAALRFIIVGLVLMALVALRPQGIFGKRREMLLDE